MKPFMDEDFLLDTPAARRLYHDYAAGAPIIDFHCHLPPDQVAQDSHCTSLARLWLGGDHYKWRAMRGNGIPERLITGDASDSDKFAAWARTVPAAIGNPLFHWTHLELRRYFGITELLTPRTAAAILAQADAQLAQPEFSARGLLKKMKVRLVATTDDPADDLVHHRAWNDQRAKLALQGDPAQPLMVPTFRPDKALAVHDPAAWNGWVDRLAQTANQAIESFAQLLEALAVRHQVFHDLGCRLSDHGMAFPPAGSLSDAALEAAFQRLRSGMPLDSASTEGFQAAILLAVARLNRQHGWTMQLHLGVIRNLNRRQFAALGPDSGFDAINDEPIALRLASLLDGFEQAGGAPSIVLYTLNPASNEVLASLMGCFQDGSLAGKIQFGSAWWFNDHLDGMTRQLVSLANFGLLSRFVGMLTDSRSFLSFPRHEYFRRLLCNLLGGWMEQGQAPADWPLMGGMVKDICYRNAARQFNFPGLVLPDR